MADYYLSLTEFYSLYVARLASNRETLSIAISKDTNPLLLPILDKALLCISKKQVDAIVLNNSIVRTKVSFRDVIYANTEEVVAVVLTIFGIIVVILIYIINLKTKNNKIIKRIAQRDSLTGLYNREAVEETIEKDLSTMPLGKYSAILSMDMDNFKEVNDTYGHPEGDQLLKEIALMLTECVRTSDIVGRMGGDEFVIYLKGISSVDMVRDKAEQIKRKTHELGLSKPEWEKVSFSIGCAVAPRDGKNFTSLYKVADIALYRAKEQGKNRCVVYQFPEFN